MKFLRYFIAAALLLGVTSVANAFNFKVLDPATAQPGAPNITSLGSPVSFSFYQCPPFIDPSGTNTNLGCFDAVNATTSAFSTLSATITATSAPSTAITCDTSGGFGLLGAFSQASCNVVNDTINVTFTGGDVQPGSTIWIVEDGIPQSDFPPDAGTFTVTATPEPSSLLLALSSMGPLGYVIRRRRKSAKA